MRVKIINLVNGQVQDFDGEKEFTYLPEGQHESKSKEGICKFDKGKGFLCMSTISRLGYYVKSVETGETVTD